MESTVLVSVSSASAITDPIDAAPPCGREALDYAWNLASAGCLVGVCLNKEPLASLMFEPAGDPAGARDKLGERELEARLRGLARACRPRPQPVVSADARLAANLACIGQALGLTEIEREVLAFLLAGEQSWELGSLLGEIHCRSAIAAIRIVALAIGRSGDDRVARALDPSGRLIAGGFVTPISNGYDLASAYTLDRRLRPLCEAPALESVAVLDRFLPRAPATALELDDYPRPIAEAARRAARLLAAALRRGAAGINLLIHGPTGSGKTELARVLAREAQAALFVAGKEDDEGLPPDARERLAALRLGHRVLAGGRAVIAFDELEDLFVRDNAAHSSAGGGRDAARMSKLWFNQLLEAAPVPTIWMANDVAGMDPAFLRRFALALALPWPAPSQRKRLWRRHLGDDLPLGDAELDDLAERFAVSPGQIETATRAARLLGETRDLHGTLEQLLAPVAALVGPRFDGARRVASADYDPALASTRVDLCALADRIAGFRASDRPGLSLCLHGPPGTGKSEFVRYLARRLDRPVLARRPSDLLSKWVGGTEQNIAAAFREARDEQAVLLLDEADGLLRDRRRVEASWEASQVNEVLQQLEVFPGIVACTTNVFTDLDQAALRRFTFRIAFEYLAADQARALWRRLLADLDARPAEAELAAAERALGRLTRLAPGDFAVVTRRLRLLHPEGGPAPSGAAIIRELEDEVAAKEPGPGARVGFAR